MQPESRQESHPFSPGYCHYQQEIPRCLTRPDPRDLVLRRRDGETVVVDFTVAFEDRRQASISGRDRRGLAVLLGYRQRYSSPSFEDLQEVRNFNAQPLRPPLWSQLSSSPAMISSGIFVLALDIFLLLAASLTLASLHGVNSFINQVFTLRSFSAYLDYLDFRALELFICSRLAASA
ncbi:hypothetical protein TNIN_130791 [Trichonephila inaurata madagascariensis]|uniref:Uncharacterized protein n=1 Tax=Trichonephila inaurata madagascariensis TaxID=2747483 RepID=A0A8X6IIA0_9ARAC|nr:hypothetical protein TNIN_130791 [Trichonephila inaurata madagascariensis]